MKDIKFKIIIFLKKIMNCGWAEKPYADSLKFLEEHKLNFDSSLEDIKKRIFDGTNISSYERKEVKSMDDPKFALIVFDYLNRAELNLNQDQINKIWNILTPEQQKDFITKLNKNDLREGYFTNEFCE
jgi:hypothetical protein